MYKKLIILLGMFLTFSSMSFADITWNGYFEGGFRLNNQESGTFVTNGVWNVGDISDGRYGRIETSFNFIGGNGWTGWTRVNADLMSSTAGNEKLQAWEANFQYRPGGVSLAFTKNQDWTWLGAPSFTMNSSGDLGKVSENNVNSIVLETDTKLKWLHGFSTKTVWWANDATENHMGTRISRNYKLFHKKVSGTVGLGYQNIHEQDKYPDAYLHNPMMDMNANIQLGEMSIFAQLEAFTVYQSSQTNSSTPNPMEWYGNNDAQGVKGQLKFVVPTPVGNFNLNGQVFTYGKSTDISSTKNWYEEYVQLTYSFPAKAMDLEFSVRNGHPNVLNSDASYKGTSTTYPTGTNWMWGGHFWNYDANLINAGQFLEYYGKVFVQFKKGIKFFTSYLWDAPGVSRIWGTDGSQTSADTNATDTLLFDLQFENTSLKIDLQYRILRLTYLDPRFRIDVGGLELTVNLTPQLKYYSRMLLVNSAGQIKGATSGSSSWWNYFGSLQYSPMDRIHMYLEYGNPDQTDRMTINYATTHNAAELERRLDFKFGYNF